MDAVADLEQRLANGERMWHWLHADGSDGERGKPNHRLLFVDVASALADLAVHDVTAAGFHDHATLVGRYAEAVRIRAQQTPAWPGSQAVAVAEDDR